MLDTVTFALQIYNQSAKCMWPTWHRDLVAAQHKNIWNSDVTVDVNKKKKKKRIFWQSFTENVNTLETWL